VAVQYNLKFFLQKLLLRVYHVLTQNKTVHLTKDAYTVHGKRSTQITNKGNIQC